MIEVNVEQDLESVMSELTKLGAELQSLDNNRTQLALQLQQLNGVAMYLRGKQPVEEANTETDITQEE
jgi:hypothetical protein|tara:strand:- start:626 stop:829 length:204 start_codon:yes stop_codon:yes gene_type:complete